MQIRFEMCVCTLFNANPVVEGVGAHALKGKNNFTVVRENVHERRNRELLMHPCEMGLRGI